MKLEYLKNRSWSETVRLYSGLLEKEERASFIKELAEVNILLAAECYATSFNVDLELDNYLASIAISVASNFHSPKKSAEGLMALTELNRFEEISKIISSVSTKQTTQIHYAVIASFISYGNELQIATFLAALASSNELLFNRAIDRLFDQDMHFSVYSQEPYNAIVGYFNEKKDISNIAKIACVFKKKVAGYDFEDLFLSLIENRLIYYAEALAIIYNQFPKSDILALFPAFVTDINSKESILRFIELCRRSNVKFDLDFIRLHLSMHKNPKIKEMCFAYENEAPLKKELIREVCKKNIELGSKSSIEFAIELLDKHALWNFFGLEMIIDTLLKEPLRPGKLTYAVELIEKNNLFSLYSPLMLYTLLINTSNYESFEIARLLITHFPYNDQKYFTDHLACISHNELANKKLSLEILLSNMGLSNLGYFEIGKQYHGVITYIHKSRVTISCPILNISFNVSPKLFFRFDEYYHLNINSLIKFTVIGSMGKKNKPRIWIDNFDVFHSLDREFYYDMFFIGQLIKLKVQRKTHQYLVLKNLIHPEYTFVLYYEETYFINKYLDCDCRIDQEIIVCIISFNKNIKTIYCSLKSFSKPPVDNNFDRENDFQLKVELLKKKYSAN